MRQPRSVYSGAPFRWQFGKQSQESALLVIPTLPDLTLSSATMLNNYVKPKLSELIDPAEAAAVLESLSEIQTLTELQRIQVRRAFSEGYNQQNIFMTALTGVGFVTTCFLWERHPRRAE